MPNAARIFTVLILLSLFVPLLSACATSSPTSAIPAASLQPSMQPATPTPASTKGQSTPTGLDPSPPPTLPTTTPEADPILNSHYILSATLDYAQHFLTVDESITYYNNTMDSLPEMVLMVAALDYPDVFHLTSLSWEEGQPITDYALGNGQLRFFLPQPLAPGESMRLDLSYELTLPSPVPSADMRPVPFGYTSRQTNLVDWYPFVPPYVSGQGWLAHQAGYYGEHLVYDIADFEVNIQILDKRDDLLIAASAPAEIDGDWHRYHHETARNFAWSISHDYRMITQTVGTVTVLSYYFPVHDTAGEMVLKTTAEALSLYSRLFGPYPRQMLTVVEADFLDGMEYDGMYFLSYGFYNLFTNTPGEYLVAIAAHETAHQWWYGLVGNDQALEPWLDEALCTYSERLFYENVFPEALDWWWSYRIHYYQPSGWVDDSIYNPHGEAEAYRSYRNAVYLNGAVFLEDLRELIGDQVFFDFLYDYVQQYTRKLVTAEDFFATLKSHTQADLDPLLKKYFSKQRP